MAKLSRRTSVGIGLLLLLFGVVMLIRIFVELSAGIYVLLAAVGLFFAFAVRKKSVFLILGWICVAVGLLLNFEFYLGDLVQDGFPAVVWLSFAIASLGLHISGSRRVGNWPLVLGGILLFCGIYSIIWAIPALVAWWKRMGIFVLPILFILTGLVFLVLAIRGAGRRERLREEEARMRMEGKDGDPQPDGTGAMDTRKDRDGAREDHADVKSVREDRLGAEPAADPPLEGQMRMELDDEASHRAKAEANGGVNDEAADGAAHVSPNAGNEPSPTDDAVESDKTASGQVDANESDSIDAKTAEDETKRDAPAL